jgi:hypothetical protein
MYPYLLSKYMKKSLFICLLFMYFQYPRTYFYHILRYGRRRTREGLRHMKTPNFLYNSPQEIFVLPQMQLFAYCSRTINNSLLRILC